MYLAIGLAMVAVLISCLVGGIVMFFYTGNDLWLLLTGAGFALTAAGSGGD